jgi:hypothetical protein
MRAAFFANESAREEVTRDVLQSSGSSGADYGRRCAEQLDEDGDHAELTKLQHGPP